jgi:hypothetical protein
MILYTELHQYILVCTCVRWAAGWQLGGYVTPRMVDGHVVQHADLASMGLSGAAVVHRAACTGHPQPFLAGV